MKFILPEKKSVKLNVGDVLNTKYDVYILSQFTDGRFAWFNPRGACANGKYNSLKELELASSRYFTDPSYTIYSSKDYDFKLVPKGEK